MIRFRFLSRSKAIAALGLVLGLLCCAGAGQAATNPSLKLIADERAADGSTLCLAVDAEKPFAAPSPRATAGPFYPVIVSRCDGAAPMLWTVTDDRNLRVTVKGAALCLSARHLAGFLPLLDPFLKAFGATEPGSPFAYLADDLKPSGKPDARRLDLNPELVAGACGQTEAMDFWVYDDPSGTISGPGGSGGRPRQCVTIHADTRASPARAVAGLPAMAANCPNGHDLPNDVATFDRSSIPAAQRWSLDSGQDRLPTYRLSDPKDYFSGRDGLPIVGPMGRCLTADTLGPSAVTSDCDGRIEQDWIFAGNTLRLVARQTCLTANADGSTAMTPCTKARAQNWAFTAKETTPNRDWKTTDLFGQIRPADDPGRCLAVAGDPFADPMAQRNAVRVVDCADVAPRQMSFYVPTEVLTIRLALVRYDHTSPTRPSDDAVKSTFAALAARLSAQFRTLGVRFVFDPDHDFLKIDDPLVNEWKDPALAAATVTRLAAKRLYHKLTIVLTDRGGGDSGPVNVDYDPARIVDPISGEVFDFSRWSQDPNRLLDKAGLPALSVFIRQSFGMSSNPGYDLQQAHELARFFGVADNFGPQRSADAPGDIRGRKPWNEAGSTPCGNLRTISFNGKTYTPDRANIGGLSTCLLGRSRAAITPMQLATMNWVLRFQLDRLPLVSCAPTGRYDADHLACEDPESLALCKETAAFLSKTGGAMTCRLGGRISGEIGRAMKYQALNYVFRSTPEGQSLIGALANVGRIAAPVSDRTYADVVRALATGRNVALARALLNRIADLRQLVVHEHSGLWNEGFSITDKPLKPEEMEALKKYAGQILTPALIANVPAVLD